MNYVIEYVPEVCTGRFAAMYTLCLADIAYVPQSVTRDVLPDTGDIDAAILVALILISLFIIYILLRHRRR